MLIVTIRTVIMYFAIILCMRFMGKRQLGELQPSELVTTILISNLASLPIEETDISLIMGLLPIALIAAMEIFVSVIELKSSAASTLISGSSKIIIRNGVIDQRVLRELRFSVTDLLGALRNKDIFDLDEVELGIIETNGQLNVFKTDTKQPRLMIPVIIDGKKNPSGLRYIGKDDEWVERTLKQNNAVLKNTLLLQCTQNGEYTLVEKTK